MSLENEKSGRIDGPCESASDFFHADQFVAKKGICGERFWRGNHAYMANWRCFSAKLVIVVHLHHNWQRKNNFTDNIFLEPISKKVRPTTPAG